MASPLPLQYASTVRYVVDFSSLPDHLEKCIKQVLTVNYLLMDELYGPAVSALSVQSRKLSNVLNGQS
jgi:hypothetical protein